MELDDIPTKAPEKWGRSTVTTACPLDCPDSCSLSITVERGRIAKIDGNRLAPSTDGYCCGKVRRFDRRVYSAERVLHPMRRTGPKGKPDFKRIGWDEAYDLIVDRIGEARARFGAESILPYHYGGSNGLLTDDLEDARFFRKIGASRLARTLCAAPTGAALTAMYGKMPGVAYEDYEDARLIVLWGVNPSASGIHLVPHIQRAQRNGAKLVVIDPGKTPLARQADLHLPVKPGTDLPVALALIHDLFERDRADLGFLERHADGVDELRAAAGAWRIELAAREAGIDVAALATLAEWYSTLSPAVVRCGWGQERNQNGGASSLAILALPAVAGKFGVRGGGYSGSTSSAWGITAERLIDTPSPPTRVVNMNQLGRALTEFDAPPVAVLFIYNCNPLSTVPNANLVRRGLERDDLFTIVHEQVLTDTAQFADLVLPATTFMEHYDVAKGYGAYHLHLVQPVIAPVGESKPNQEVFRELGIRLGVSNAADNMAELGEAGALMDAATRMPPAAAAALLEGAKPQPPGNGRPIQFVDVVPKTPDGLIHLHPSSLAANGDLYAYVRRAEDERFPLSLISPASEHTISSTLAELRPGIAKLKMNPADAESRAISNGEAVRVYNDLGEVQCEASVSDDVRPGTLSLPKGLWARSTFNGGTAAALAPDTLSTIGGGACFNDTKVQVELYGRH